MWKSIQMQLIVMLNKKEFQLAFSFVMLWALGIFLYQLNGQQAIDIAVMGNADQFFGGSGLVGLWSYFNFLFPFLVVLPFATSYINEVISGTSVTLICHTGIRNYIISKVVVCFIGGFLIISIPFLINYVMCQLVFPHNQNMLYSFYGTEGYETFLTGTAFAYHMERIVFPFLRLYLQHPHLYYILYIFLMSSLSGLLGVTVLCFSFLIRKSKLLLFVPLFILFKIMSVLTDYSYSIAGSNPYCPWEVQSGHFHEGPMYIDFNLLNYVVPFTQRGQSLVYLLIILLLLGIFCICGIRHAMKGDLIHVQGG